MEQSSGSPEKPCITDNNPYGSEEPSSQEAEIVGNATIDSNPRRSRAAKEAAKRKLAEPDDGILDILLETKKIHASSSVVDRNSFRRVVIDSDEEEALSGDENESEVKRKMKRLGEDEVERAEGTEDSESDSDDDSDEEEYEDGLQEEVDEEYEDDEEEEGPSNRPVKRMSGMSPLKRPRHSVKFYPPKLKLRTGMSPTGISSIEKPAPSAGFFDSSDHSSNQSIKSMSPPTKAFPTAAILQGYKNACYDGGSTDDENEDEKEEEKEDERVTPTCPSEISNTSTSDSSIEMPILERQEPVQETVIVRNPAAPKLAEKVFYRPPEEPVIPTIEFAFPPFTCRPSTIRPSLDIPLPGAPSFDSLTGKLCPRVYVNKTKVKQFATTGKILGEVAFKPELYLYVPESAVQVSLFYYNATRDSDTWLRTPIVTVFVRYGKEMKVPFIATVDMNLYLREGENSDSLLSDDSLLREETLAFVGVIEYKGLVQRSHEERMVFRKRLSTLPYMYPRPIVPSPSLMPPPQTSSQPQTVRVDEPYIEDPGVAPPQVEQNFVLPPVGEICEKIIFNFDAFTSAPGTSTIRPSIELPIPGCPTVGELKESRKIPRIFLHRSNMREFIKSGTVSGRIEFTPGGIWPEQTVRISIFYFNGIRNTTEWSRTPFFTFIATRREMKIEFTATVDLKVYLGEKEDLTKLLDEDSILRTETLSFVAVVAARGVILRSKEERMIFRKKKTKKIQQPQSSAWGDADSGEEYVY